MREIELFYQRIRIVCGSNYNLNTFPTKGGQSAGRKKFAKFELLKKLFEIVWGNKIQRD